MLKGRYIIDHTHVKRLVTLTHWCTCMAKELEGLEGTFAVCQPSQTPGPEINIRQPDNFRLNITLDSTNICTTEAIQIKEYRQHVYCLLVHEYSCRSISCQLFACGYSRQITDSLLTSRNMHKLCGFRSPCAYVHCVWFTHCSLAHLYEYS